jgi:hypothetical protein
MIYFSIKDINFEQYLKDSMSGFRLTKHFDDASIFIERKPDLTNSLSKSQNSASSSMLDPPATQNHWSSQLEVDSSDSSSDGSRNVSYKNEFVKLLRMNNSNRRD